MWIDRGRSLGRASGRSLHTMHAHAPTEGQPGRSEQASINRPQTPAPSNTIDSYRPGSASTKANEARFQVDRAEATTIQRSVQSTGGRPWFAVDLNSFVVACSPSKEALQRPAKWRLLALRRQASRWARPCRWCRLRAAGRCVCVDAYVVSLSLSV